jgi:hypothetical protein
MTAVGTFDVAIVGSTASGLAVHDKGAHETVTPVLESSTGASVAISAIDTDPPTVTDASRWSAGDGENAVIGYEANGAPGASREVTR